MRKRRTKSPNLSSEGLVRGIIISIIERERRSECSEDLNDNNREDH